MVFLYQVKELTENFGYSGHGVGIWDAICAISLGAKVIEKHFTIDKNLPGRDNKMALLPEEFRMIADYAVEFDEMMIDHGCDYQNIEKEAREVYAGRWG